jgi:hypothetical protein
VKATTLLFLLPVASVIAFGQSTSSTKHEEHQSTSTQTSKSTSTSPRKWSGRLVNADCNALSSRWGQGSTSADRSASTSSQTRSSETRTTDQNTSAEGRPATDRTTASQQSSQSESSTSNSADRASPAPLSSSDLDSCAVTSTTTSYAVAMPNGQVYRLSGSTLSDDIHKNKNWNKQITNNNAKNIRVNVTGDLSGDTITVERIK